MHDNGHNENLQNFRIATPMFFHPEMLSPLENHKWYRTGICTKKNGDVGHRQRIEYSSCGIGCCFLLSYWLFPFSHSPFFQSCFCLQSGSMSSLSLTKIDKVLSKSLTLYSFTVLLRRFYALKILLKF